MNFLGKGSRTLRLQEERITSLEQRVAELELIILPQEKSSSTPLSRTGLLKKLGFIVSLSLSFVGGSAAMKSYLVASVTHFCSNPAVVLDVFFNKSTVSTFSVTDLPVPPVVDYPRE